MPGTILSALHVLTHFNYRFNNYCHNYNYCYVHEETVEQEHEEACPKSGKKLEAEGALIQILAL